MDKDSVQLSINTYNKFKVASVKADLVIGRLFDLAQIDDENELTFNPIDLADLLKLAYPERYKNKIEELKATQIPKAFS